MRWLINYLRQMFCTHDWHLEEAKVVTAWDASLLNVRVSATCRRCAWHQGWDKW